jgi:hypothetical protein
MLCLQQAQLGLFSAVKRNLYLVTLLIKIPIGAIILPSINNKFCADYTSKLDYDNM